MNQRPSELNFSRIGPRILPILLVALALGACARKDESLRAAVESRLTLYTNSQDAAAIQSLSVEKLKDGVAFLYDGQNRVEKDLKEFVKQHAMDSFGTVPGVNWDEAIAVSHMGLCTVAITLRNYPARGQSFTTRQEWRFIYEKKSRRWTYWDRTFADENTQPVR